ncbi:fatty acid desaturase [Roseovarius salinarum]|uniref:fatty acid desaturase n=1 Tax=Roseovarius salinarum TaxID=1981892 RepID=UPI000C331481|nr:fatty acid desaturase [Roseovarius salinarum]
MDHRDFIARLPRRTLVALSARRDAPGLAHLAGHLGLIAVMGAWIVAGGPAWWVLLVPQGIALCFLFTLQHEATHKTPFATEWLNEAVGHAAGAVIFQPFTWFRYFHLAHHRHTNDPERDPELLAGAKPETRRAFAVHVSGLPYWLAMARRILVNALGRHPGDFVPGRARGRVRAEARWMLAFYAMAGASLVVSSLLVWVWLLPLLLGQPFLRLYLLAEHGRCAHLANMFDNTRTTFTNRIVRFLAWNMPYHVEHHVLPQVPFHKLPQLHARMAGHHRVTAEGYGAFTADYVAHLTRP